MSRVESAAGFLSIGQAAARTMALRAAASGRLDRTLLVHGPPGAGKGAFVADLLALLFCTEPDAAERPCNRCAGCRSARDRSHPDLLSGSPERWREERSAGESIVAAARRWLLAAAGAPVVGERRVVLIEGADRAGEQIQNALLKALEEPAPRQMFILVADDVDRLLPTIRSRSQPLRLGSVPRDELAAWLVDHERLPADQADDLAGLADGLPGRAAGFARNPELVRLRRGIQQELLGLLAAGRAERFAAARELLDQASRQSNPQPLGAEEPDDEEPAAARGGAGQQRAAALVVLDAWIGLARDLLVASLGRPDLCIARELLDGLADTAAQLEPVELTATIGLLERAAEGLRQNASPRLALETAMLAWPQIGPPTQPR